MYASQSWVKELVTKLFKKNNEYMLSKTCNYSLEEQVIGTWIDGKPLYQKTFIITSPSVIKKECIYSTDLTDIDTIWVTDGFLKHSSYSFSINYGTDITTSVCADGSIYIYLTSQAYTNLETYITVRYTKATE